VVTPIELIAETRRPTQSRRQSAATAIFTMALLAFVPPRYFMRPAAVTHG